MTYTTCKCPTCKDHRCFKQTTKERKVVIWCSAYVNVHEKTS